MKEKAPIVLDSENPHFVSWFAARTKAYEDYMREHYPAQMEKMEFQEGSRYIKIFRGSSVETFIDRTNGDVLKSASWRAPAKGARGNIFDEWNGMKYIDPAHGPFYLR